MLTGRFIATIGVITCVAVTLSAQWRVTTNRVPMTPDGKPNYGAPAPKMADETTPDLSGSCDVERRPCIEADSPFGCSADTLDGIPVGFIDITTGLADTPPMQPWAEALLKQHSENGWINDPNLRCLPHSPPRMWAN